MKLKELEESIKLEEIQLGKEQIQLEKEMASLGYAVSSDIHYNRSYSAKTMVIKNFEKYRAQVRRFSGVFLTYF